MRTQSITTHPFNYDCPVLGTKRLDKTRMPKPTGRDAFGNIITSIASALVIKLHEIHKIIILKAALT